jgi:hypothetical protein
MSNHADKRAADLSKAARAEFESLLGRPLDPEERVSLRAYRVQPGPEGDERIRAWERLERTMDTIAQKVRHVPPAELESLLDEVSVEVRHGPR